MSGLATYTLPKLPYAVNALEPTISAQIMELHHGKHHATYVANLNKALAAQAEAVKSNNVHAQIALQPAIKFNGGGHINHSLFWENLAPASEGGRPDAAPKLLDAIHKTWGNISTFKELFNAAALGIQGSGWVWLTHDRAGALRIVTTKDQDPIVDDVPVFGVDMWEHGYYLQYLNNKAGYLTNIWTVINWTVAEKRFLGPSEDVFASLRAVM